MFSNFSNSFSTKRPRYVQTFGRLASLSLLCSALCLPLSGLAAGTNALTQSEVETAVYNSIVRFFATPPMNFSGAQLNTVPWLFPSTQSPTLGEWLFYVTGYPAEANSVTDTLRARLAEFADAFGVTTNQLYDVASDTTVLVDQLEDIGGNLFAVLSDVNGMFAPGYGEYYANVDGDGALRVTDPLVLDLLDGLLAASTNVEYYLDEMLGNDNADRDEGTSQASQQAAAAQNMVDDEISDRDAELHEVMDAEETTSSYLHGLIEDFVLPVQEVAESAYPGDENSSPGLEFTDFRSQGLGIKLWNDLKYPNGDVWIGEQYWSPSSWGSPNNPDAPNAMLRNFGTMMSYVYGVGFGLWVFMVVRNEWRYYMLGGGSDAHIQAEQLTTIVASFEMNSPWLIDV